jgi:hypothetical protein
MNSAPRGGIGERRRTRKENAGAQPALGIWRSDMKTALEDPDFAAGANPQDPAVLFRFRRVTLTMAR